MGDPRVTDSAHLAGLLTALGSLLVPLGGPPEPTVRVTEPVLWDPLDPVPPCDGGVLLLVGAAPTSPVAVSAIEDAGRLGYAAIAVKARDGSPQVLQDAARRAGLCVLVAPDDASWSTVDATLRSAIATHRDAPAGDLATVATGDLFTLANVIASLTGCPITIEDATRHVLAYSNLAGQPIDRSRRDSILGRLVPDLPGYLREYRVVGNATGAVYFEAEDDVRPRVAVPVRVGQRPVGSIWAQINDDARVAQVQWTLTDVAPICALHLMRAIGASDLRRQQRGDLLAAALSTDGTISAASAWAVRERLPVTLLAFGSATTRWQDIDEHRITDVVALSAETVRADASCAWVGPTLFVLLPESAELTEARVRRLAESSVRAAAGVGAGLVGAYSGAVDSVAAIGSVRRELETLVRALRRSGEVPVAGLSADRHRMVLQEIAEAGAARPDRLVEPVRRLLEHDAEHGTRYAQTLLAHLDRFGDVRAAAAELVVHENSHRYRMRRIVEQFDLDLADPELRLVVWLQLRAVRPVLPR